MFSKTLINILAVAMSGLISAAQETITSTGEVWAVGITNLQFSFTHDCSIAGTTCSYDWIYSSESINVFEFSGDGRCPNTFTQFVVNCDYSLPLLSSDLTIKEALPSSANGTTVDVESSTFSVSPRTIVLKYCDATSLPSGAVVSRSDCGYLDVCDLSCSAGYKRMTVQAQCKFDATWNDTIICERVCNIMDNCLNCDIAGGNTAIAVGENKTATCQAGFGSPNDPEIHTCSSTGEDLVFDLQCTQCDVTSTCNNCIFQDGEMAPTAINDSISMTATCVGSYFSADDPQKKTCTNGTAINFDLNCTETAIPTTTDMLNATSMKITDPDDIGTAQTIISYALITSKPSLESTASDVVTATTTTTQAIYNVSTPSTSQSINWTSSWPKGNSSLQGYLSSLCVRMAPAI